MSNMTMQTRRKALGWSIRELSRRSGVSFGYLSEIERGNKPFEGMTVRAVRNVAEALGTTASRLIEEEEHTATGP